MAPEQVNAASGSRGTPHRTAPAFALAAAPWVRALSADVELLQFLRAVPARLSVHSVFARVINVDAGDGRLLTLACRGADDAPDSIVVSLASWAAFDVVPGTQVVLGDCRNEEDLGLRIELDGARPWRGRLPAFPQNETALRRNLRAAWDHLERHGRGVGACHPSVAAGRLQAAMAMEFRDNTDGLCRALARRDEPAARVHVDRLVGLGSGLTPSGDDFLLGLLAALHLPGGPASALNGVGAYVVNCAGRQTHPISAAALRHAARGRVRACIADLFSALARDPVPTMLAALDRVMAIGSGSGSEIAFGVLVGLRLHLEPADSCPGLAEQAMGVSDER